MQNLKFKCGLSGEAQECGYATPEVGVEDAQCAQESGKSSKKPDRPSLDMDTTEGEWGIFEDSWVRCKQMTGHDQGRVGVMLF